jgi:hypothetical protein
MAWRAPKYSTAGADGKQTIVGYDYAFGDRPYGAYWEGIADADVPKPPAAPNVQGFKDDLKAAMGGAVAANLLARTYPLFYAALQEGVWADVQALILDAKATAVLSAAQYAAFQALAAKHALPVVLP